MTPESELIFLVEEDAEGGYTANALGASIFTEADGPESLRDMNSRGCAMPLQRG